MTLKTTLHFFGLVVILLTLLPFTTADLWWIHLPDFPQVQLTLFTLSIILFYARLHVEPEKVEAQNLPPPEKEDIKETKEQIAAEKEQERK